MEAGIPLIGKSKEFLPILGISNLTASVPDPLSTAFARMLLSCANRGIPPLRRGIDDAPKGVLRAPPMTVDSTIWNQLVGGKQGVDLLNGNRPLNPFKSTLALLAFAEPRWEYPRIERGLKPGCFIISCSISPV